jgi:dTDP-4-dehydrorhamnose reductase
MLVTGREGQVVRSLLERNGIDGDFDIQTVGRPQFDLASPSTLAAEIQALHPDIIVAAAAYTAVDQAETDEQVAMAINAGAAGEIARAAAALKVPLIHLSTDYVFDGAKPAAYCEGDAVAPLGAYGRTKLAGEMAVAAETADYTVLRTAWVYSPFGRNFLKTMLRLAGDRERLGVVDDQIGNPTSAFDIADGILAVACNLLARKDPQLRGVFHMTAAGEASWADFAEEIFRQSRRLGGPSATVDRIASTAYPTPAKRPANSRLDCRRLADRHGVHLPDWRPSTALMVDRLLGTASQG